MKNFNIISADKIIDEIHERLPHISRSKIKTVYHLLQREIKIGLVSGKRIKVGNFIDAYVKRGVVKKFWCVFHKEIRKTFFRTMIECKQLMNVPLKNIKKHLTKGRIIENVETRGNRNDQKYAYRTAQRANAKTKQGQKL